MIVEKVSSLERARALCLDRRREYVDMIAAGIVDPKVTQARCRRQSIWNALDHRCLVTEIPEKEKPMIPGGMPGERGYVITKRPGKAGRFFYDLFRYIFKIT